jgi:hypothetical protein
MEEHYAQWTETMFPQFGHKWIALHREPAWQYEVEDKVNDDKEIYAYSGTERDYLHEESMCSDESFIVDRNLELDAGVSVTHSQDVSYCSSNLFEEALVVENRISDCGVVEILSIDRYQNK